MAPNRSDLSHLLGGIIETAIALTEADFGNIQLLDPDGRPRIIAHRGFPEWWIENWNTEASEHGSWGLSLALGKRIVVEDVEISPIFAGTPGLDILLKAGVRAIQSTPLRGRSGQVLGMLSTHYRTPRRPDAKTLQVLDLLATHATLLIERERAEEALSELEAEYRTVVETSADGFWAANEQGRLIAVNDTYVRCSGYSREELLTMHIADLEAQEDPDAVQRHREKIRSQGADLFETTHRAKSGALWPVEVNVIYRPMGEGRYFAFLRDITERKQAQQALEHTRNMLTEAQKIAHLGSFEYVVDSGKIVWSEEEYRIYGLDQAGPSPSLEEIFTRCILPEEADQIRRGFLEAVDNHRDYDQEHRIVGPDDSVRWVHTRAHPYFDEQGKLLRYVGMTLDVTKRKRQEEEAHIHNELLQSLARQQVAVHTAAAFAHELNQPLVAISAYSEVALRTLRSGKQTTDQLAHAIEGSHEQAHRAGKVLQDLMDHLHKGEPEPGSFDINELVRNVIDKMRRMECRRFHATLDLGSGMPPVRGNHLQTEKVLANLVQNGIEAMVEAGLSSPSFLIVVRALAGRNMAQVTVRDSGPGLDADTARRIFEPFFSTKSNGLGLGLAISRSLIEAQAGQLWLDPADGPGAVFHFTLPFAHE